MVVSREIAKLRFTPQEAWNFSINHPPEAHGITVDWLEWQNPQPEDPEDVARWMNQENYVVVEFITSDKFMVRTEQKTEKDIRYLMGTYFRNRVVDRRLSHPKSPPIALRLQAPLNHPLLVGPTASREMKRAMETADDVTEVVYTRKELERSPHPEMISEGFKDASRGQTARQWLKNNFAMEAKYSTRRKEKRYIPEKGYEEVDTGEEELHFDFGTYEKG